MPVYVYETIPNAASATPRRFELQQKMSDPPLTVDPETGDPVQRVISGGFGMVGGQQELPAAPRVTHSHAGPMRCGSGHCGCH